MMENTGRNLAHLARRRFLDGDARGSRVLVLSGKGGNGGGGMVCARRLHTWGADVAVWLSAPASELAQVPSGQLAILQRIGMQIEVDNENAALPEADLIVDALVGYSLSGPPAGITASLVRKANGHKAPVLALDVPSGLDATTGEIMQPAVTATATMTLALPKAGLASRTSEKNVGEQYLADTGVPPELYSEPSLGIEVGPIFANEEIIRLRLGHEYR